MTTRITLQYLHNRHDELQRRLNHMQIQHETLKSLHTREYLRSIEDSVKSLFEVIICVRKADKNLVDWHYRNDNFKSALRFIGLDRRTTTVIKKKTEKLKAQVSVVESKFGNANDTVATGLRATESLKSEFVHFSQNSVDQVSRETIRARNDLDSNHNLIEHRIGQQREEQLETQDRIRETSHSLKKTTTSRQNAEGARDVLTASKGSIVGFGAAAVSAMLFPPSLLFTGSALAAGAGAGALACVANEDANNLEAEQQRLTASLSSYEDTIKALESELSSLDMHRSECADAIKLLETLQTQMATFRAAVQQNIDCNRNTKISLDKTRLKLADIVRKLHECRYEETRRCIATRLREVLAMIQADPMKRMAAIKPKQLRKAIEYLADVDNRTVEVMTILEEYKGQS